jgi:hypothetical protein
MKSSSGLGAWCRAALVMLTLTGCATSTIESRKQQRYGVYAGLTEAQKSAVDAGQIKVGMPMDAVYIAWGKPDQVLNAETSAGPQIRWLYAGTYLQSFTHWTYSGAMTMDTPAPTWPTIMSC